MVRMAVIQTIQSCDVLSSTRRRYTVMLDFDLSKVTNSNGRNNEVQLFCKETTQYQTVELAFNVDSW